MGSHEDTVRTLEVELGRVGQGFRELGDYAYTMVGGKTPAQMPDVLHATFAKTIEGAPTPEGVAVTAGILDELLARKTVAGRPPDLADDLAWVRAASGRAEHPDQRLPLIG